MGCGASSQTNAGLDKILSNEQRCGREEKFAFVSYISGTPCVADKPETAATIMTWPLLEAPFDLANFEGC